MNKTWAELRKKSLDEKLDETKNTLIEHLRNMDGVPLSTMDREFLLRKVEECTQTEILVDLFLSCLEHIVEANEWLTHVKRLGTDAIQKDEAYVSFEKARKTLLEDIRNIDAPIDNSDRAYIVAKVEDAISTPYATGRDANIYAYGIDRMASSLVREIGSLDAWLVGNVWNTFVDDDDWVPRYIPALEKLQALGNACDVAAAAACGSFAEGAVPFQELSWSISFLTDEEEIANIPGCVTETKKLMDTVLEIEGERNAISEYVDSDWVEIHGDLVITDPNYTFLDDGSWDGAEIPLMRDTLYGDWSCHVFDQNENVLGEFCADGGMVCVDTLENILKRHPQFLETYKPRTRTILSGFHGRVRFVVSDPDAGFPHVQAVGEGMYNGESVRFESRQTGF